MPNNIYNTSTNLQAQGRFAPGVSYRADIRKPTQPVPNMPEVNSAFNIDLSSIANAYADVKKTEISSALSERELNQRLKLAEMEDDRMRDIAEMNNRTSIFNNILDRDTQWKIANMQNDTELLKLAKEKEKNEKDLSQTYANNMLYTSLREAATDYTAGKIGESEFRTLTRKALDSTSAAFPNADMTQSVSAFGRVFPGVISLGTDKKVETEKALNENDTQTTLDIGDSLPQTAGMDSENKYLYTKKVMDKNEALLRYMNTLNSPEATPEQKKQAETEVAKAGVSMAEVGMYSYIYNRMDQLIQPGADIYQAKKDIKAGFVSNYSNTFGSPLKASEAFDTYWKMLGAEKTMKSIGEESKGNLEFAKTYTDTMVALSQKELYMNFPGVTALAGMPAEMRTAMLDSIDNDSAVQLGAIGEYVFGIVKPVDDKWTVNVKGQDVYTVDQFAVDEHMKRTGTSDPKAAVRLMYSISQNMNRNKEKYPEDTRVKYSMASMNSIISPTAQGKTDEDIVTMARNIQNSVNSGTVNVDDTKNYCEVNGIKGGQTLCDSYSAWYKLAEAYPEDPELKNTIGLIKSLYNPMKLETGDFKMPVIYYDYDEKGMPYLVRDDEGTNKSGRIQWRKDMDKVSKIFKNAGLNPSEGLGILKFPGINIKRLPADYEEKIAPVSDTLEVVSRADSAFADVIVPSLSSDKQQPGDPVSKGVVRAGLGGALAGVAGITEDAVEKIVTFAIENFSTLEDREKFVKDTKDMLEYGGETALKAIYEFGPKIINTLIKMIKGSD